MTVSKHLAATTLFVLLSATATALAQENDAANCKDHPMFSRMKGFYLSDCKSSFDEAGFYLPDKSKTVEGQKTTLEYALIEGSPMPSPLQVRRNYGNAAKSLGGAVLFDEDRRLTARVAKGGKEVWLGVEVFNEGRDYTLTIVEVGEMTQEVTANDMLDALNKSGFIALYINFDTGKADIKPESMPVVDQITKLLKDNGDLKVSIEGHTDNVGSAQSNQALSERRAQSVVSALVKGGIAANRLSAAGWGQGKPIADNRSEEGRAKNRRVEIVKK